MKNCKKEQFGFVFLMFFAFLTSGPRYPRIFYIFDFAVCVGVFYRFPYDRSLFSVIFLHFLLKYRCVPKIGFSADIFLSFSFIFLQKCRCVPKIGFSADIFLSFSFIFFRSIVVYLKLGSRLTFLLTFFDIAIEIWLAFVFYAHFWHFYWHLYWHSYWHFDWHLFLHFYWHFYWHVYWHFDWQGGGKRKEWISS